MAINNVTNLNLSGKLFVIEGADGVGKSTISKKVKEKLGESGVDAEILSFPGHEPGTLGKLIYDIHHKTITININAISPECLQMLHIAAHIDCIQTRILPAISDNKIVILDRYWWSTVAYGLVDGISDKILNNMIKIENEIWNGLVPNHVFLIVTDKPYKNELSPDKWQLVGGNYLTLFEKEKHKYRIDIIENNNSIDSVINKIVKSIRSGNSTIEKSNKHQQATFNALNAPIKKLKITQEANWSPTRTTEVFDTYWYFAAERQNIFFKRLTGELSPWTNDYILSKYKFTNAYRASDRVSQFLIKNVIYGYESEQDPEEIFFRIILFKTFNKIETWNLLAKHLGQISWKEFDFKTYDKILVDAMNRKQRVYSAAYIMPSGGNSYGHTRKHRNHLALIVKMMEESLVHRITESKTMQEVFDLLRSYPMIGDFLAYQYAIDINYSILTDFNEMSFVVPGPGAKDGLRKCFSDFGGLSEIDLIQRMAERQEEEFKRLDIDFLDLFGRPLQLIDCQNIFCEVDKYARIAHPNIQGITGRTKIKQKFKPNLQKIDFYYPPKWKLTESIRKFQKSKKIVGEK